MGDENYKIVDLFCGAGGFSFGFDHPEQLNGLGKLGYEELGWETEGFKTIYALDDYEAATETIEKNFDCAVENSKIQDIDTFSTWDDADVVLGGPPCQGFSQLNSTKTEDLDDERNHLWKEYFRAVEDINPEVFVVENVPRFLDSPAGKGLVELAEEHDYTTVVGKLDAADYGVPQHRKRAFVIGSKQGTPFLPTPTREPTKTVRQAIGDLPMYATDENLHNSRNFSELTKERMKKVPRGGNRHDIPRYLLPNCWKDYEDGGTDLFGRLRWNEPSVTIRTSFHKPMKGRHLHPEAGLERTITLREGARLQTFPDDFEFGTPYQVHTARLIGNAVPPKLAYHIAKAVKSHLQGEEGKLVKSQDFDHGEFLEAERQPVLE
ncbi:DNA cytosine methyltransferase [Halobacterium zhouii]|uniref:DNA cytosine methyltransferase n=1 Tax=Halobacterium zhouii TaxID=2902624 RepID=UPI001E387322|nr:DNA cytosine methyltransferase [Halobacterium zhouii]